MSSSPGGVVRVCTCKYDHGRVNESDPSLPCVGESLGEYILLHLCNDMENVNDYFHTIVVSLSSL